jgi:hypothetical protein
LLWNKVLGTFFSGHTCFFSKQLWQVIPPPHTPHKFSWIDHVAIVWLMTMTINDGALDANGQNNLWGVWGVEMANFFFFLKNRNFRFFWFFDARLKKFAYNCVAHGTGNLIQGRGILKFLLENHHSAKRIFSKNASNKNKRENTHEQKPLQKCMFFINSQKRWLLD